MSLTEYAYTTGDLDGVTPTNTFAYVYDTSWKDQLVEVTKNGETLHTFDYDQAGNPTIYKGATLTWKRGRLLHKYNSIEMEYDASGIRREKVVPVGNDKTTTTYIYDGDKLIKEVQSGNSTCNSIYLYNSQGIIGFVHDGITYAYRKNLFGDIIALYRGATKVAEYRYDAWGNCKVFDGNSNEIEDLYHIAHVNPFRYRGYYWDNDLQLYYLMSRYYDPQTGRFINADSLEYLDPETIGGLNLYAYCGNNPIMYVDPSGHIALSIILIAAAIGFAVSFGTSIVDQLITTQKVDWGVALVDGLFGAIDGALATLGLGWGLSLLIDAALNFSNALIVELIESNGCLSREDWRSIMITTALSTAVSAVASWREIGFDNKNVNKLLKEFDEVDTVIKNNSFRSYNDSVSKKARRKLLQKKIFTNKSVIAMYAISSLTSTASTCWCKVLELAM